MEVKTAIGTIGAIGVALALLYTAMNAYPEERTDPEIESISYNSVSCNTREIDEISSEGSKMLERGFYFKNPDGSIDEIVYLKDIQGKVTPFYDGAYVFQVSDDDRKLLMRLVFAEAGTTGKLKEQVAIAAEVLNRMQSPDFPDTIPEVLAQENQYYPGGVPYWTDSNGDWRPVYDSDVSTKVEAAVELALEGADPTEKALGGTGALYHYEPIASRGDGKEYIHHQIKIGDHKFYRSQVGLPGYKNVEMVP